HRTVRQRVLDQDSVRPPDAPRAAVIDERYGAVGNGFDRRACRRTNVLRRMQVRVSTAAAKPGTTEAEIVLVVAVDRVREGVRDPESARSGIAGISAPQREDQQSREVAQSRGSEHRASFSAVSTRLAASG